MKSIRLNLSSVSIFYVLILSLTLFCTTHSQFLDPILDDTTYLDSIEKEVMRELEEAKASLMNETKVMDGVAKEYIQARVMENIYKALVLLEKKESTRLGQKVVKQESDDEEAKPTQSSTGVDFALSVNQLVFGVLGGALKVLFGGAVPKKDFENTESVKLIDGRQARFDLEDWIEQYGEEMKTSSSMDKNSIVPQVYQRVSKAYKVVKDIKNMAVKLHDEAN